MRPPISLIAVAFGAVIAAASCKSNDITATNTTTTIGQQCIAASDGGSSGGCAGGAVCSVNYCRTPCMSDRDCVGGVCLAGSDGNGCRVEMKEGHCTKTSDCATGLVCASDGSCRNFCFPNTPCGVAGDVCSDGACYGPSIVADDGGSGEAAQDGNGGVQDAASSIVDGTSPPGDATTPTCSSPLAFGLLAMGDSKPQYQAGTGTRTTNGLVLLTSFGGTGPEGGYLSEVESAAFDLAGNRRDAGAPAPAWDFGMTVALPRIATTSPNGTSFVLYYENTGGYYGLGAALLNPDLTLRKTLGIGGATGQGAGGFLTGGDVQWAGDRFVAAWPYELTPGVGAKVQMFGTDGSTLAGTPLVTDVPSGAIGVQSGAFGEPILSVALSGTTIAIGYLSTADGSPRVQLLDINATPIGGSTSIAAVKATAFALAGTPGGFVGVYDGTTDGGELAQAVFIAPDVDGGPPSIGTPMRLPGGPFVSVRATSDGTGGGFAILRSAGLGFGYAKDGLSGGFHETPVMPASGNTDNVSISSFGGRFGLFRYATQEQRMYGVATGCPAVADGGP